VFSQLSPAVVRHEANDGVVYAIRAWFKTTIVHCLQWYKLVLRTRLSTPAVQHLIHKRSRRRPPPVVLQDKWTCRAALHTSRLLIYRPLNAYAELLFFVFPVILLNVLICNFCSLLCCNFMFIVNGVWPLRIKMITYWLALYICDAWTRSTTNGYVASRIDWLHV